MQYCLRLVCHDFIAEKATQGIRAVLQGFFSGLLLLCPFIGEAAQQQSPVADTNVPLKTVQRPAVAPSAAGPIAVADVAARAAETDALLQGITQRLAPSTQVDMIKLYLPDTIRQIDQSMETTSGFLREQPTLATLQAQEQQWQHIQAKITGWLDTLTRMADELQQTSVLLSGLDHKWSATLTASQNSKAPVAILQQINGTLASIRATERPLQTQLTSVLDLQSKLSGEIERCGLMLAKIAKLQQTYMSGILVKDSKPIVSTELWTDSLTGLQERTRRIGASFLASVGKYLRGDSRAMPLHVGVVAALSILFLAARRQVRKRMAAGEALSSSVRVFAHPIGSALTVSLLIATSPYWTVQIDVRRSFQVIAFATMIILLRPTVPARLIAGLYMLWLLFLIDSVREIFSSELLIGQIGLIIESLGGIAAGFWLLRRLQSVDAEALPSGRERIVHAAAILWLLVMTLGFAAAAAGYLRLARLMTAGVVGAAMLALALYASLLIIIGSLDIASRLWPLRTLKMVQHKRGMLERRLYHVLAGLAVVGWTTRYLDYIGFLQPALSFGKSVLRAKYQRGDFSISLGDVLAFFLTVWGSYLLSAFVRFVLQEDVYPRIRILQGRSYAVSSLLHYMLIALGFLAGMLVLGVNLTKLSVLTGALGVGIGFGLQSVVNNFVSGLILLFERPIQVGDIVELGDLLGKVRRIGIRASTVRTRQGADIIVPNSQLVTEKVTNWTLSDRLRRIDLPVGVSYSSAPKDVIKVLEGVAITHPEIVKEPAPHALFMGYGDSSINFELRAWTDLFDDWPRVRSELATAVFDAVHAAGMSFPFPQREVRLLGRPGEESSSTGV